MIQNRKSFIHFTFIKSKYYSSLFVIITLFFSVFVSNFSNWYIVLRLKIKVDLFSVLLMSHEPVMKRYNAAQQQKNVHNNNKQRPSKKTCERQVKQKKNMSDEKAITAANLFVSEFVSMRKVFAFFSYQQTVYSQRYRYSISISSQPHYMLYTNLSSCKFFKNC